MSEAKHTPGPWDIFIPNSLSNDDMAYGIDTANGRESESVVLFYGGILKKEDASLIAAAPDLLEALRSIVNEFDKQIGTHHVNEYYPKARAAIAKATGKTQ